MGAIFWQRKQKWVVVVGTATCLMTVGLKLPVVITELPLTDVRQLKE